MKFKVFHLTSKVSVRSKVAVKNKSVQISNPTPLLLKKLLLFTKMKLRNVCEMHCLCLYEIWITLLLNEGIPRALEGKKLRLKIPRVLPSIFELFLVFQIWGQNTIGGQYLQNINALIFWYKYLQKVNAMPSDFWWKKTQVFSPLMNIF